MVADSRQVALNHTAGLSLPQQVQMTLFAAFALLDTDQSYKMRTRGHREPAARQPLRGHGARAAGRPAAGRATTPRSTSWAGPGAATGASSRTGSPPNYEPIDPVFRLADEHSVVLLNGGGFDDSAWSVRVSLANLLDDDYLRVGASLRSRLRAVRRPIGRRRSRPDPAVR